MQGQTDTPLSVVGRAQAGAVGARLAHHPFDALYSSDLSRAYETAAAIARVSGHGIRRDPALRERTFGIFEGLIYSERAERYPAAHALFSQHDPDYAVPGGESPRQFYQRSLACLNAIAQAHVGQCVVVVTHGLVIDTLHRAAHQMTLDEKRVAPLFNASLNTFRLERGAWVEVAWGDVTHLAGVGVTRYF